MKRLALTALLLVSIPFGAAAAPPSDAQIDRLLEAMRTRETLQTMLPRMEAQHRDLVQQLGELNAQQRASVESKAAASFSRMREALAWERLQPLYRDLYRETFSAEEIDAMIAFYGSPAGQSARGKMPALAQRTDAELRKRLQPMLQELQDAIPVEVDAPAK